MNESKYLVLPRLEVQHANALQAQWLVAPPGPMTFQGAVHALGRRLGVQPEGFAIVHHDVHMLAERVGGRWYPHQVRGSTIIDGDDRPKNGFANSLQPTARCHVMVSLVLEFSADAVVPVADPQGPLHRFLFEGRLAGGHLVSHGKPVLAATAADAIKAIGAGYAVHDRRDLVATYLAKHGGSPLDAVLRLTAKDLYNVMPWMSAAVIGYVAISSIQRRAGARDGHLHAYVEPLVGLIQYLSIRSTSTLPMWRYQADVDEGLFLVQAQDVCPVTLAKPIFTTVRDDHTQAAPADPGDVVAL
jgi:hypothetical protein